MLIKGIAFGENRVAASAFLDSAQLAENITTLKKLSRQFYGYQRRFDAVLKELRKIRETRNLFIHGVWNPGSFGDPGGFATVTDYRTSFDANGTIKSWTHSQESKFHMRDFQDILNSVNFVFKQIESICEDLSSEKDIEFEVGGITQMYEPKVIKLTRRDDLE